MESSRDLMKSYLFHLKLLERAKPMLKLEIKQHDRNIAALERKKAALITPREIPSPVWLEYAQEPSYWRTSYPGAALFGLIAVGIITLLLLIAAIATDGGFAPVSGLVIFIVIDIFTARHFYKQLKEYNNSSEENRQRKAKWQEQNQRIQVENQRLQAEHQWQLQEDERRIEENQLPAEEVQREIEELQQVKFETEALLEDTKEARRLLYSAAIIPHHFRNLEAASYFYSLITSTQISLDDWILHLSRNEVKLGFKEIPDIITNDDAVKAPVQIRKKRFWDECKLLAEQMRSYSEDDDIAIQMKELVSKLSEKEFGKTEFHISGGTLTGAFGTGAKADIHYETPVIMNDDQEELMALLNKIYTDLKWQLRTSERANTDELLQQLHQDMQALVPKPKEDKPAWYKKLNDILEPFGKLAGIAGLGLAAYTQFAG